MLFENEPKINMITTPDDDLSSFAERMKSIYNFVKTRSDELKDLYATDIELFRDTLDDITEQVAQECPPFQEAFSTLKKVRINGGKEAPLISQLNNIRSKIKQIIISEAGLPDEVRFSQIENARMAVAEKIKSVIGDSVLADPSDALAILGIQIESDQKTTYIFPRDLMPKSVNDKWETYLAIVCKHLQLAQNVSQTGDQKSVEAADRSRRYAHDSVTNDVHVILGLEGVSGWDRLKTRELLAKIRDSELPSIDAASGPQACQFVEDKTNEINVVTALAQH